MIRQWRRRVADGIGKACFWPAVSLAAICLLWSSTLARSRADTQAVERNALRDGAAYAQAYEHFLNRSVSQMDQTTMQLKYDWEKSHGSLRFEDLLHQGLFTESEFIAVSIYDRAGTRKTSTKDRAAPDFIADDDYFRFHSNNISTALRMTLPGPGSGAGRRIGFSRRLDGPDDSFDGVIVMLIDAEYFSSFYSVNTFGNGGMVAMVSGDGDLLLEHTATGMGGRPRWQRPQDTIRAEHGTALLGAVRFGDRQERFIAWRKSDVYPFTAVVGWARTELMAANDTVTQERRTNALFATLALAGFGLVSFFLAMRLETRKREAEGVRVAYRTATDNASDGFYMVTPLRDGEGRIVDFSIVDCNERGASFFSRTRKEMLGSRLAALFPAADGEALVALYATAMEQGFSQADVCMPADETIRIQWAQRTLVRVGNGLAVTLHDISRYKNHEQELTRLANEDGLTGLPNRYWFVNHLASAIEHARGATMRLGLLFIDLDGFKHVNDTQGHEAGDALLEVAARRLAGLLRPSDHVVRFGGDEFIVLIDPLESPEQAAAIAQRVLAAFAQPFDIGEEPQSVGASVGISIYPDDARDAMTLIKNGDIAMYARKTEGKGGYRFYEPSLLERLKSKARNKLDLIEAIEQDQLVLHYQPRVDALTGELCSMEALVRWIHPTRGLIPPVEFIPLAEDTGLIIAIGEIVMEKACRQLAEWRRSGARLVPISINVSPAQFHGGAVHRQLAKHLSQHDVAAELLEVEITESAMIGNQPEVLAELDAIRALGLKLHIDDFGTGYSSLSQLQKLKMDVLKVDRAFTSELGNSRDGKIFFQAIVSMAHALGMTVVAEGVETAEQLSILRTLGCNEVQGYFISRPVPAAEMLYMMQGRFCRERVVAG